MKIVIFGLGSIGQRHARLLKAGHEIYAFRSRKDAAPNELGLSEIYSWSEVELLKPDWALIANPTNLHLEYALECAKRKIALFIEKPIGHSLAGLDALLSLVRENRLTTYVAYVLRFHPVLNKLQELLKNVRVFHARVRCTSYLPEWRENQNHLKCYSASKDRGGGAILDLSHEFDYIQYLFGDLESISGKFGKLSSVTLDAEDYVDAFLHGLSHPVTLHMDLFSRKAERLIQVDTDQGYFEADLVSNVLKHCSAFESWETPFKLARDDLFQKQHEYFIDNIGNPKMMNCLEEASSLFKKIISFKEGNA